MNFYRDSLRETADRHGRWAAERYASVGGAAPFWTDRAAPGAAAPAYRAVAAEEAAHRPVAVAAGVAVADYPCVAGDFVAVRPALRYPGAERPVAFVGGQEVVPFLQSIRPGATPVEIALARTGEQTFASALALAFWMLRAGILVERDAVNGAV